MLVPVRLLTTIVGDVVAVVVERGLEEGGQPEVVHPQVLQVVQFFDHTPDVAQTVAVGVPEGFCINLINNLVFEIFYSAYSPIVTISVFPAAAVMPVRKATGCSASSVTTRMVVQGCPAARIFAGSKAINLSPFFTRSPALTKGRKPSPFCSTSAWTRWT